MADLFNEAVSGDFGPVISDPAANIGEIPDLFGNDENFGPQRVRISIPDFSFLLKKTGPGAIDEYLVHPLNYDNAISTARILRGFTGMVGDLDYALVDIALGVFEKIQGKRNEEVNSGNE